MSQTTMFALLRQKSFISSKSTNFNYTILENQNEFHLCNFVDCVKVFIKSISNFSNYAEFYRKVQNAIPKTYLNMFLRGTKCSKQS